jgi:hypothetical protein
LNVPELQQPDLLTDRLPLLFREMGQLRSENVPTYKPTVNRLRTTLSSGLIFVRVLFMFSLNYVRTEIERMRVQVSRQRKEILQLQRSGIPTASAELLLARMHAKIDQLRSERERLKREQPFKPRVLGGRSW